LFLEQEILERLNHLEEENKALRAKVAELEAKLAKYEKQNSTNRLQKIVLRKIKV
jgi:BMFP domain-containing protein YqiC